MKLSTNLTDFASGEQGLVEYTAALLKDRKYQQWSKSELVVHLSKEQFKLASIINDVYERFFLTSSTTPAVAGQTHYAMPPNLIRLMGIEVGESATDEDPTQLVEVPVNDRRFYQGLQSVNQSGSAGFYFISGAFFRPMPTISGGTIRVYHIERLTEFDINEPDTVSSIPLEFHDLLCLGAARRANGTISRVNDAHERQYAEGIAALVDSIGKFSLDEQRRIEPDLGGYGDAWWPTGIVLPSL